MRPIFRNALVFISLAYFFFMILGEFKSGLAYRLLPSPLLFFTQIAGLFPSAKVIDVEFRAEGWSCNEKIFYEIDTSKLFPIQAGNKENRFQRVLYFYGHNHKIMSKLDQFLTQNYNHSLRDQSALGYGVTTGRIGGVRLVAITTPIPRPEIGIQCYRIQPLSDFPFDHKKVLYESSSKRIWENCRNSQ